MQRAIVQSLLATHPLVAGYADAPEDRGGRGATLVRLRRGGMGLIEEYLGECRFVKLRGSYGWEET